MFRSSKDLYTCQQAKSLVNGLKRAKLCIVNNKDWGREVCDQFQCIILLFTLITTENCNISCWNS